MRFERSLARDAGASQTDFTQDSHLFIRVGKIVVGAGPKSRFAISSNRPNPVAAVAHP